MREFSGTVPSGAMVLDAGAGDSPYRKYFAHTTYEAADICLRTESHQYAHVNYVCDLTAIPVPDSRYDLVLCTQVLEHVSKPLEVLRELRRVLKPGGRLWLSTPLFFEEHEAPHDYFRYTQFGLRHLIEQAGLELIELDWVSGYFGTLAHQLNMARHALPWRARDYGGGITGALAATFSFLLWPFWLALALIFAHLDLRHRYTGDGHCMDYRLIACKPAAH